MGTKSGAASVWALSIVLGSTVHAQVTQRVSVGAGGMQGNNAVYEVPKSSADGRYVAFATAADNLVPGDTNGFLDVFLRDRLTGTIERVSVDSSGGQGISESYSPSISADGRYVAFYSISNNLVAGDTNFTADVFVRDRQSGTTERVSVDTGGAQGNDFSALPSISADGRYVAFESWATNLVPADTNTTMDIFVRDRLAGTTERVSVDSGGGQCFAAADLPAISADGRCVSFLSYGACYVAGDTNETIDVFVHDRHTGVTERVSVATGGAEANPFSYTYGNSISADGRYVAFYSDARNLVDGDTNASFDVFLRDRVAGTTERVNLDSSGAQVGGGAVFPSVSADGNFVAFHGPAAQLVPGDTNGSFDVFVRNRQTGTTERVSLDSGGEQGNWHSGYPWISADGRFVAFWSLATNLVPSDTNVFSDIFVRDREGGTAFTSLCNPGVGGVIACPCANPPSGPGRGCDNSAATGGAILSALGGAILSSDSLVFTTSGEKASALSIVTQWISASTTGSVFGMGVRCTSGTFKRLYTKSASAGSITAPDFAAGDLQVSARSAALGDAISAGQSRWYLVFYRDPTVLGGCPASSTFNATQTGRVDWTP